MVPEKLEELSPKKADSTCKSCPWYSYRGFGRVLNKEDTVGTCVVSGKYVFPDSVECYYRQVEKKKELDLIAYSSLIELYKKIQKNEQDAYSILKFYYDKIYLELKKYINVEEFVAGLDEDFKKYCALYGIAAKDIKKEEKK